MARLLGGRRIATAESCTVLLAARLTDRPGSAYVAGGVVAYANQAKIDLLGVDPALIEAHGAVSQEVAEAMALGAVERSAPTPRWRSPGWARTAAPRKSRSAPSGSVFGWPRASR